MLLIMDINTKREKYIKEIKSIVKKNEKLLKKAIAKMQADLEKDNFHKAWKVFNEIKEQVALLYKEFSDPYKFTEKEERIAIPELKMPLEMETRIKRYVDNNVRGCLNVLSTEKDPKRIADVKATLLSNLKDVLLEIDILKERIRKAENFAPV